MSYNTLETKRKDVISNFDEKELKQYLFYLTKEYYEGFLANDEDRFSKAIDLIYEVIEEYNESYSNINEFVIYCLYLNANLIISKIDSKHKFELTTLFKYDCSRSIISK